MTEAPGQVSVHQAEFTEPEQKRSAQTRSTPIDGTLQQLAIHAIASEPKIEWTGTVIPA